jgi:addiction module RelE/StbE family toxin
MDKPDVPVVFAVSFNKDLKKLPLRIQLKFKEKLNLFMEDPKHPLLNAHQIHRSNKKYWEFYVTNKYRVIYALIENVYVFYRIGTHSLIDKFKS